MSQALVPSFDLQQPDSLSVYLKKIHEIEVLSADEERDIARRYVAEKDVELARQLVVSNLRFVVYIAKEFMGYGLPLGDLIQQGNIGLMKAVKRYDPEKKVRVIAFATKWIKSEIYEFLLHNWRIVRMATTKAQRKLFFNLRKFRKSTGWMKRDEVKQLAQNMGLEEKDVREMEVRMQEGSDVSFNQQDDEDITAPELRYEDSRYDPQRLVEHHDTQAYQQKSLAKALEGLDERSRDIIAKRWLQADGKKQPLHELAETHHVSMERIRQIESKALATLRSQMTV